MNDPMNGLDAAPELTIYLLYDYLQMMIIRSAFASLSAP